MLVEESGIPERVAAVKAGVLVADRNLVVGAPVWGEGAVSLRGRGVTAGAGGGGPGGSDPEDGTPATK